MEKLLGADTSRHEKAVARESFEGISERMDVDDPDVQKVSTEVRSGRRGRVRVVTLRRPLSVSEVREDPPLDFTSLNLNNVNTFGGFGKRLTPLKPSGLRPLASAESDDKDSATLAINRVPASAIPPSGTRTQRPNVVVTTEGPRAVATTRAPSRGRFRPTRPPTASRTRPTTSVSTSLTAEGPPATTFRPSITTTLSGLLTTAQGGPTTKQPHVQFPSRSRAGAGRGTTKPQVTSLRPITTTAQPFSPQRRKPGASRASTARPKPQESDDVSAEEEEIFIVLKDVQRITAPRRPTNPSVVSNRVPPPSPTPPPSNLPLSSAGGLRKARPPHSQSLTPVALNSLRPSPVTPEGAVSSTRTKDQQNLPPSTFRPPLGTTFTKFSFGQANFTVVSNPTSPPQSPHTPGTFSATASPGASIAASLRPSVTSPTSFVSSPRPSVTPPSSFVSSLRPSITSPTTSPKPSFVSSRPSVISPTGFVSSPRPSITSPASFISSLRPSVTSSSPFVSSPRPPVSFLTPLVSSPRPAVTASNPFVSSLIPLVSSPIPSVSSPTSFVSSPRPSVTSPTSFFSSPNSFVTSPRPFISSAQPQVTSPKPFVTSATPSNPNPFILSQRPTTNSNPFATSSRPSFSSPSQSGTPSNAFGIPSSFGTTSGTSSPFGTSPSIFHTSPSPFVTTSRPFVTSSNNFPSSPFISSRQPIVTSSQPAVTSPHSAITSSHSAVTSPHSAVTSARPAVTSPRPVVTTFLSNTTPQTSASFSFQPLSARPTSVVSLNPQQGSSISNHPDEIFTLHNAPKTPFKGFSFQSFHPGLSSSTAIQLGGSEGLSGDEFRKLQPSSLPPRKPSRVSLSPIPSTAPTSLSTFPQTAFPADFGSVIHSRPTFSTTLPPPALTTPRFAVTPSPSQINLDPPSPTTFSPRPFPPPQPSLQPPPSHFGSSQPRPGVQSISTKRPNLPSLTFTAPDTFQFLKVSPKGEFSTQSSGTIQPEPTTFRGPFLQFFSTPASSSTPSPFQRTSNVQRLNSPSISTSSRPSTFTSFQAPGRASPTPTVRSFVPTSPPGHSRSFRSTTTLPPFLAAFSTSSDDPEKLRNRAPENTLPSPPIIEIGGFVPMKISKTNTNDQPVKPSEILTPPPPLPSSFGDRDPSTSFVPNLTTPQRPPTTSRPVVTSPTSQPAVTTEFNLQTTPRTVFNTARPPQTITGSNFFLNSFRSASPPPKTVTTVLPRTTRRPRTTLQPKTHSFSSPITTTRPNAISTSPNPRKNNSFDEIQQNEPRKQFLSSAPRQQTVVPKVTTASPPSPTSASRSKSTSSKGFKVSAAHAGKSFIFVRNGQSEYRVVWA
ncbi:mucin-2-like [Penaeus indicus]|uniref:mucin-2-like n=1 Tax=Penaeus indicus TaxID=29960 RepID=UPI00300CA66A